MDIQSQTSSEEILYNGTFLHSTLPMGSTGLIEDGVSKEPTQKTAVHIHSESQGGGEWICATDLLQMSSSRKRPRLLPDDVKMYVFIQRNSKHTLDLPSSIQTEEMCERKELYDMNKYERKGRIRSKRYSVLHPKKQFLERFLQSQEWC